MLIEIKTNFVNDRMQLPDYAHPGDAGFDLQANVQETVVLWPGQRELIPSGIRAGLSHGWQLEIRPRSGLALKKGISVLNSPGTIDAGYRGDIGIILMNHSAMPYEIKPGDRIAQAVLMPVFKVDVFRLLKDEEDFEDTSRNDGGFGSTGE